MYIEAAKSLYLSKHALKFALKSSEIYVLYIQFLNDGHEVVGFIKTHNTYCLCLGTKMTENNAHTIPIVCV